jgi:hypothetical protein
MEISLGLYHRVFMGSTVTIEKRHFMAAVKRARELGKTPEGYIESLIDAATLTLDDVLAPARSSFRRGGATEEELDDAVAEARKAVHKRVRRKSEK